MSPADPFAALNAACVAVFGQTVSYKPAAGERFTLLGILEKATDEEQHADGAYARLFVKLADCASQPDHGDQVTVAGVAYTVFGVLIDASGGIRLSLRLV